MNAAQRKHSKTALVLAGGGLTGAVYEIGALRAIDDLLINRTVNDFDIYIGTSAGALVAAGLANGLSPEALLAAFEGSHPEIHPVERRHLFSFNTRELARRLVGLPRTLLGTWAHYLRHLNDMTLFDVLWSLSDVLPSGLYDGLALEAYVRQVLAGPGRSNRFANLARDLYIIATDLDSGERAVFGRGEREDVPVSLAVAASSALPLLYKPVQVDGASYVDGSLRGTASLDLAIERGANLVVCINPMVPYEPNGRAPSLPESDGGDLNHKGVPAIAAQVLRIVLHAGLRYHVKQLRRSHPQVDIILIEPRPDDCQMFFYNIMRYSARLKVARYGFESVTLGLAEAYQAHKEVLARHGILLSRRLVISELAEIERSGYDPAVIRRVLEAKAPRCGSWKRDSLTCQLSRTLAELELTLEAMAQD